MFVARLLLWCLGWQPMNEAVGRRLKTFGRSVLVFSHTSYADFYIMLLYKFAYWDELPPIRVVMKPQPFQYAGWLLRNLGAIPAGEVGKKGSNSTSFITKQLDTEKNWAFLISPKGTIDRADWRTGYYYIAKELQLPLTVVGLDYEIKDIWLSSTVCHVKQPSGSELEEPIIRRILQTELSQIVPLFPADEVVPIRTHDGSKVNMMSSNRKIMGLAIIFLMVYIILYYK